LLRSKIADVESEIIEGIEGINELKEETIIRKDTKKDCIVLYKLNKEE